MGPNVVAGKSRALPQQERGRSRVLEAVNASIILFNLLTILYPMAHVLIPNADQLGPICASDPKRLNLPVLYWLALK